MKKVISGKVREVYDMEDGRLVIVTTDRISAFDVILPTEIPGKGEALNAISAFWFEYTRDICKNHLISSSLEEFPVAFQSEEFRHRTAVVKKLKMIPYEVIVRGYMFGSMYEAYKRGESFLAGSFKRSYQMAERLDEPIVTPSTKATEGHDVNVTLEYMKNFLGEELGGKIERTALALYNKGYIHALANGMIIADTKFEFGLDETGDLVLADEVLTPDSSRFWDATTYKVGESPKSFDKQFVRDWLIESGHKGDTNLKELPADVVEKTSSLYRECQRRICGL